MIYWITGRAGAGKTTKAKELLKPGLLHLDGDKIREITGNVDFTDDGRERNITIIAKLARLASLCGIDVVVSCVSPTKALRMKAKIICGYYNFKLIYITREGESLWEGTIYEEPDEEELIND